MIFDVIKFGAAGDGAKDDTTSIQAALDACREVGGGTVLFPNGRYLLSSVRIYSNTTVRIESGARLLLSDDESAYGQLRGRYDEPFTRDRKSVV